MAQRYGVSLSTIQRAWKNAPYECSSEPLNRKFRPRGTKKSLAVLHCEVVNVMVFRRLRRNRCMNQRPSRSFNDPVL